ncbi:type II toxin-antitoxin system RelE/ParE family toxin [Candidatus Kaiserbacteria bacterium]|nr:type II toxin-antitoxin system RelE/ParE family toxin [Candidatus Kaiserbacteria bacterium]
MLRIDIWPEAQAFLETLAAKHKRQISAKVFALAENPMPPHSKLLEGFPLRRFPSGEYRIVYFIDGNILKVVLIDRRNDDRIYRRLKQLFK